MSLKTRAGSFLCSLPKAFPGTQLQTADSISTDRHFIQTPADPQTTPPADLLRCGLAFRDRWLTASFAGRPEAPRRTEAAGGQAAPALCAEAGLTNLPETHPKGDEREEQAVGGSAVTPARASTAPRYSHVSRRELPQPPEPAPSPQAPVFV